jgi:hypothetical protein
MDCGSDKEIVPAPLVTLTWLVVPVMLAKENPEPLPINSLPFAAVEPSTPVPPRTGDSCASELRTPPDVV